MRDTDGVSRLRARGGGFAGRECLRQAIESRVHFGAVETPRAPTLMRVSQCRIDDLCDADGRFAITERVAAGRAQLVQRRIVQQRRRARENHGGVGADQFAEAGCDAFRSFRRVAQNENRFTEGRDFFLNAV